MRRALAIILLASPLLAGSLRNVPGDNWKKSDAAAVNINFQKIDNELGNAVTKTGTQTITGTKNFGTITSTSGTVTTLNTTTVTATALTATTATVTNLVSTYPLGAFKNRIINGAMVIDQRNAGGAVTVNSTADTFPVDRFHGVGQATDGVFTLDQDTASTPDGFRYAVKATVTTADASIGTTQVYVLRHKVEGYNISDAGFGTSWAKQLTLSFWVRSSVTGTFGGAFLNSAANRSYPFTYSISSADTWEKKTVTFTADTTETWVTGNGIGLQIIWALGMGSTYKGTAETWAGSTYFSATGATDLISTINATWYITGVQLELGPVATAFEQRPVGTELAICQRYYEVVGNGCSGGWYSATSAQIGCRFAVTKRGTPTITILTSTPIMAEPGIANRNGSGSTYSNNGTPSVYGLNGNIDGFSGATANNPAILTSDALAIISEL